MNDRKGLTLVEAMVGLTIFMVVSGMMYGMYLAGQDLWKTASTRSDLQAQARNALQLMTSELLGATRTSTQNPSPNADIPSHPNNKQMHFHLPQRDANGKVIVVNREIQWDTNNQIDYQYIPGQRILRRLENGVHRVLAREVEDVEFSDISIDPTLAINEIKIVLTLSAQTENNRPLQLAVTSVVRLRN